MIAAIDRAALLRLTRRTGGFAEVVPFVGSTWRRAGLALRISGASADADPGLVRRVFVLARQRTIDQDPAFVLRMLVDIAIRALSPAVNDPTTAVQVLDRIETLLVELAGRRPGPSILIDDAGRSRARITAPRWSAYAELGLMEIRRYGADSPQVVRRLYALYDRLSAAAEDGDARERIELERRLLDQAADAEYPDPEERRLVAQPDRLGLGFGAAESLDRATVP